MRARWKRSAAGAARGRPAAAAHLARLGLRSGATRAYAPTSGHLRLVVTRNRHGNCACLASKDLGADLTTVMRRKRARWSVESVVRDTKQLAGLAACQARVDQPLARHVALVLLTFVVLQRLRRTPQETVGGVKARWQLAALRAGAPPPARTPGHRVTPVIKRPSHQFSQNLRPTLDDDAGTRAVQFDLEIRGSDTDQEVHAAERSQYRPSRT